MTTTPVSPYQLRVQFFDNRDQWVPMAFPAGTDRHEVLVAAENMVEQGKAMTVHLHESTEWGQYTGDPVLTWGWQRYGA
jgi:hypothetical protein